MKPTIILLFSLIFLTGMANGQTFRLSGKVVDKQLEPLAFASVQVRELKTGTTTKEDGTYEFQLEEGKYDILISMIGFQPRIVTIFVNQDIEQNFILEQDEKTNLSEVVIRAKVKDRSEEVIRHVIENKEAIQSAAGPYSTKVYIKATQQHSLFVKGLKATPDSGYLPVSETDLDKMAMAEISLKVDYASAQQLKEERLGVTKRGDVGNLFYLTVTDGEFSLYNNLIRSPSVSEIPFISPISFSGLLAYRFKTIKTERKGKRRIYTISIKPRQLSNATVEGEVTIDDSLKVILHSKFSLPVFHLPEYDFFEVEQHYGYVNNTAWMITRQKFTYYSKYGKGKKSGETVALFKDFEFNK